MRVQTDLYLLARAAVYTADTIQHDMNTGKLGHTMENYSEYLNTLGSILGSELSFNENNDCQFIIEEDLSTVIHLDEERNEFLLLGNVADELPDPVDYSLILDLLSFAYAPAFGTAPGVGRDPESGIITAWSRIPINGLSTSEFCEAVRKFIEFQIILNERVRGSASDEDEEEATADENSEAEISISTTALMLDA